VTFGAATGAGGAANNGIEAGGALPKAKRMLLPSKKRFRIMWSFSGPSGAREAGRSSTMGSAKSGRFAGASVAAAALRRAVAGLARALLA
jgi:hypothetical protein